jgi:ribosomal protein S18 acetylase RimI-like enzyme
MPVIELLGQHHDRESFRCGNSDLDGFLHEARPGGSPYKVWVMVQEPGSAEILSFYAPDPDPVDLVSEGNLHLGAVTDVVWLRYLATDRRHKRRGYGEKCLLHLMENLVDACEVQPIEYLFLDAADEGARDFYLNRGLGFRPTKPDSLRLVITIEDMRRLFEE